MSNRSDPVIIVGAGPVGMGLAALLVNSGVKTLVVEREEHVNKEWRASTFHPPTLEGLESLGITDKMIEQGLVADRYQIRDRGLGLIAEFDYKEIATDTAFPFRLQLEQYKFVQIVAEYLADHPLAELRFGSGLVDIDDSEVSPVVTLEGPKGPERVRAKFVVGADGASSTTRKLLGLNFEGWTYPQRYLLISTDLPFVDHLPDICSVNYIADPEEFVMLLQIPDIWRVLVPIKPKESSADAASDRHIRKVLEDVTGSAAASSAAKILGRQVYSVHQRVAERFHGESTVLIGDAAHLNSPMGGFGLNSGMHDAFDIAERIKRMVHEDYSSDQVQTELHQYSVSRRAAAIDHVRKMSHENTRTLMEDDEGRRTRDRERLSSIAKDPEKTREYLLQASMLSMTR